MQGLADLARWMTATILALLFVAIAFQLTTGHVRLKGIFRNKVTGAFDPGRAQLLVLTLYVAGGMLTGLASTPRSLGIPAASLLLLTGSHSLYLIRKVLQLRPPKKGD